MPSLSMATSLIAFGLLKAHTALMMRLGWKHAQFTPQACSRPRLPCTLTSLPCAVGCCYDMVTCVVLVWWHGHMCASPPCCRDQPKLYEGAGAHAVPVACMTAP